MSRYEDLLGVAGLRPQDVEAARTVVVRHLAPTPLVRLTLPDVTVPLWAKLETLQPTGAFKVRGALAATSAYAASGRPIITASAGNHGLGIAFASGVLGTSATVVVPHTASLPKVEALRRLPVDLVLEGDDYEAAESAALARASESDGRFVSAYDDPQVIAGQSTVVSEVAAEVDDPVTVVVPAGGGGLLAGSAIAAAACAGVDVIGVETEQSQALSAAVAAGKVVDVEVRPTIADGLAGNLEPGSVTPSVVRAAGVPVVQVGERAIRSAVAELATAAGLVVEGSAAVGLAALRSGLLPTDRPLVLALTGRNIAPGLLAEILAAG